MAVIVEMEHPVRRHHCFPSDRMARFNVVPLINVNLLYPFHMLSSGVAIGTTRIGQSFEGASGGWRMDDIAYLAERAQQELSAALKSTDSRVRNVHVDFADAYVLRIREAQAERRRSTIRLVEIVWPALTRPHREGTDKAAIVFQRLARAAAAHARNA